MSAVKGAAFAQYMKRSEMVCFDKPIGACQNRYWVNTIHSDMTGGIVCFLQMQNDGSEKRKRCPNEKIEHQLYTW